MMPFPRFEVSGSALRLPPIETWPRVVGFAQSPAGKFALFAVFAGLMKLVVYGMWIEAGGAWLLLTIAAAAVSLAGRHRHLALLVCTAVLLVRAPSWFEFRAVDAAIQQEGLLGALLPRYLRAGSLVACVVLAAIALHLARRYRDHPLGHRPVLAQHILYFCMIGLAAAHLLHGLAQALLWSVTAAFSAYFWFLAYALMDQRRRQPAPALLQFASFNPLAWSSVVPMGGGAANLRSVESGTPEALAVTQLKALKLLAWALVLKLVLWLFRTLVYGKLGVPPLRLAFDRFLQESDAPVNLGLASILANFPEQLLVMALWGHVIVATARLAGFRLLRNTWRPLESRSIAEFWNRYFYFFKEMLVHVYFYPAYVRWFKRHPRLRLAFATFMAAGVGNFLFHFMLENHMIARVGLLDALVRFQTYAFYCLLLVAGIVLSQLRARRPDANEGWVRGRFLPSLGVMAFFCFLSFFDVLERHVPLSQHFAFLLKISGIERWIKPIV